MLGFSLPESDETLACWAFLILDVLGVSMALAPTLGPASGAAVFCCDEDAFSAALSTGLTSQLLAPGTGVPAAARLIGEGSPPSELDEQEASLSHCSAVLLPWSPGAVGENEELSPFRSMRMLSGLMSKWTRRLLCMYLGGGTEQRCIKAIMKDFCLQ